MEWQKLIGILLNKSVYHRIIDEQLEILVIVVDGTLSLILSVKILIHRTHLRHIAVLERLYLPPFFEEFDKYIIAFLGMLAHLTLISSSLAVLDERSSFVFSVH